ncbi:hypothetical protein HB943_08745 [Listeria weihenstephanensis]|uniref:Uncharacterized protein n=1 Tax=Listeria weihenstephanensis TaxID=1006155 RepID=A0A841Z5Z9_9LIST|nr:hypothetical protein [Listeria weihenstephanensis]MBC1500690.1 hypothetical protein [Listeria weihenstephanensis]
MKKIIWIALMFATALVIIIPIHSAQASSITQKLDPVEEKYDLKEISIAEAKADGALPIKFNTIEDFEKYLANDKAQDTKFADQEQAESEPAKSAYANSPFLSLFIPHAKAASDVKNKTLWSNGVSTTKGYARVTKNKNKKITAVSTWSNQSGVSWPIGWDSVTSYHKLKSGSKSGTATFAGNKVYYIILPVKEIAYKRYVTYTMGF